MPVKKARTYVLKVAAASAVIGCGASPPPTAPTEPVLAVGIVAESPRLPPPRPSQVDAPDASAPDVQAPVGVSPVVGTTAHAPDKPVPSPSSRSSPPSVQGHKVGTMAHSPDKK